MTEVALIVAAVLVCVTGWMFLVARWREKLANEQEALARDEILDLKQSHGREVAALDRLHQRRVDSILASSFAMLVSAVVNPDDGLPVVAVSPESLWQEWIKWHNDKVNTTKYVPPYGTSGFIPPYKKLSPSCRRLVDRMTEAASHATIQELVTRLRRTLNLPEEPVPLTMEEEHWAASCPATVEPTVEEEEEYRD